jgi:hypothetical protein
VRHEVATRETLPIACQTDRQRLSDDFETRCPYYGLATCRLGRAGAPNGIHPSRAGPTSSSREEGAAALPTPR